MARSTDDSGLPPAISVMVRLNARWAEVRLMAGRLRGMTILDYHRREALALSPGFATPRHSEAAELKAA
jgi:hypothetical protein